MWNEMGKQQRRFFSNLFLFNKFIISFLQILRNEMDKQKVMQPRVQYFQKYFSNDHFLFV